VLARDRKSLFVALHPVRGFAAQRLLERARHEPVAEAATDITSVWAAQTVAATLPEIGHDSTFTPVAREAIDYLRNWDYRYDLASIGALIFDTWMGMYTGHIEPFPAIELPSDSLARAITASSLRETLIASVDSLSSIAGRDQARWRLEAFRPGLRHAPVWSFDALSSTLPNVNPQRYASLSIRRPGHPTTLEWESGLFDYPDVSPSHVVARVHTGVETSFAFRPDYEIGNGIIARHVASPSDPSPQPFPRGVEEAVISIRPTP
jgi:hypothetical protein